MKDITTSQDDCNPHVRDSAEEDLKERCLVVKLKRDNLP
jgi:hypothetical protein